MSYMKINEHTTLNYIEPNQWIYNDDDIEVVTAVNLSFTFYDCNYMVYATLEDLEKEHSSFSMIEGDSQLFDSFSELCNDGLSDLIKTKSKEYIKNHEELHNP